MSPFATFAPSGATVWYGDHPTDICANCGHDREAHVERDGFSHCLDCWREDGPTNDRCEFALDVNASREAVLDCLADSELDAEREG